MAISEADADAAAKAALVKESTERNLAARVILPDIPAKVQLGPQDVECRVLPMGDGKVSTGQHVGGISEAYYLRGETFGVHRDIAMGLEKRGYVEILEAPAAPAVKATPKADA